MLHTLRCYLLLLGAMARGRMQYRFNFFVQVFGMVATYMGQFIGLSWLVQRFGNVAGWQLEDLILMYALAILAWGITVSLFFHLVAFEDQIREGLFDRALVRPLNPFIQLLAGQSPIAGMGQLIFSIGAFIWAAGVAGVVWTPLKVVYLLAVALGGGLILGSTLVVISALGFLTRRTHTFYWGLIFPARQLIHYPLNLYSRTLQILLTVGLPFAFINYYPAHYILDRAQALPWPTLAYLTPLVGVLSFTLAYGFWRLGLRAYVGAGS